MYKNGEEITLTKEEAIRLHKEMWNYILEEEKKKNRVYPLLPISHICDRYELKDSFMDKNNIEDVHNNCFLCEFAKSSGSFICDRCPGNWPSGHTKYAYCVNRLDETKDHTSADPAYIRDICD